MPNRCYLAKKKISVNKVKESASHRICEQQVARITPDINHFYAYCIKTSKQIDDAECELRSKIEVGEKWFLKTTCIELISGC
jgi:hypothetical protein